MRSVRSGGRRTAVPVGNSGGAGLAFGGRPMPGATTSARRRRRSAHLGRRSEPFLLMAGATALVALLATLYLTEANQAAMMTYQINDLQRQQNLLLRDQGDLNLQLHQLQSLQRIQTAASSLGMVPVNPTAVVYMRLPAALDTVTPAPPIARAGQ